MDVPKPKTKKGDFKNCKNSSLFDIGRSMEATKDWRSNVVEGRTGNEKLFYEEQRAERRHLLSQEIDTEYEAEQLKIQQAEVELETSYHEELNYTNGELEVMFSSSKQKSHTENRVLKVDKNVQVNIKMPSYPIRLVWNATYEILDTVAGVSTASGISVAKAQTATCDVCKRKYGDIYELELPKQSDEPRKKKSRTAEDYQLYANVLPSEKSVNNFKHKKALIQERSLQPNLCSPGTTKVTLHYDTTSRIRNDGDWPSLICNVKDKDHLKCWMISLCPLFFAYEDQEQIISLMFESLKRLSVAANKLNVAASNLWEKTDAIMTDAVSKNLKIEDGVAEALQ